MRAHALSLSDRQMSLVKSAAKSLPVGLRDKYLQTVAGLLANEPSDFAVSCAVNRALDLANSFVGFDNNGVS